MDIVIRATVIFRALYVLARLLGSRQLAQLTPFELIVLVTMGDLVQQGITHNDFSATGAILAVVSFGFWASVLAWVTYVWPRAEALLDGTPSVIVRDGEWLSANMRRARLTAGEVETEMRLAGIAHVADVAWGILEPKGRISFIERGASSQQGAGQEETIA